MPNFGHQFPSSLTSLPSAEPDLLGELGRATTAYHEAPPDRLELAREEYERVLIKFKSRYMHWSEREPQ